MQSESLATFPLSSGRQHKIAPLVLTQTCFAFFCTGKRKSSLIMAQHFSIFRRVLNSLSAVTPADQELFHFEDSLVDRLQQIVRTYCLCPQSDTRIISPPLHLEATLDECFKKTDLFLRPTEITEMQKHMHSSSFYYSLAWTIFCKACHLPQCSIVLMIFFKTCTICAINQDLLGKIHWCQNI